MATLTENITATQKVILVSGSTPDQGHFRIRIDDELMDVEGFDRKQLRGGYRDPGVDRTRWIVTRGVGGTTAATHSAGDTLMAAASALVSSEDLTPPLPFAGEAGGVQTVSLLGPFVVNFNDAAYVGDPSNWVAVTTIPAGSRIMGLRCEVTTAWDAHADNALLEVAAAGAAAANPKIARTYRIGVNWVDLGNVDVKVDALYIAATEAEPTVFLSEASFHRWANAGTLAVRLSNRAGATQGSASVEVLIASPS